MAYPKPKKPARIVKKSSSWIMQLAALLPFVPPEFMRYFWTTVGHTIYAPSIYDADPDWGTAQWYDRLKVILDHENIHIAQEEQAGIVAHTLMYLGPSVPCLLAGLIALGFSIWSDLSWWVPGGLGIVTVLLAPLTAGLAYGRWVIEREAYMTQMDQAVSERDAVAQAEWIADVLWRSYFFTWPKSWAVQWFLTEVKKKGRFLGGRETDPSTDPTGQP